MRVHTHMYGVDVPDGELNVLRQVAYWQIGHTGSQDWTDQGSVI